MFQRGWFHLDIRRQELLPELLAAVRQYGPARVKPLTASVVDELAEDRRFAGLIIQVGPDTLPALDRLFERAPSLPVLALLEQVDRALVNQLQARGVATMVLPLQLANTVSFVQRALSHHFVPNERVGGLIAHMAETRMLTAREVQLVSYCLGDEPRARVRRRLGITENTLKSQIRGLLRKCGERNLDSLAKNVLRLALLSTSTNVGPQHAARLSAAQRSELAHDLAGELTSDARARTREPELESLAAGHSEITRPAVRLYKSGQVVATQH